MTKDDLIETLADIEHQRWADWQKWLHSKCSAGPAINRIGPDFGRHDLIIPAGYVAALDRQIATPYADLSEQEKQSDREQVMRYWTLIVAFVGEWLTSQGARISDHNPEALDTADWLLGCWREDMEPKP